MAGLLGCLFVLLLFCLSVLLPSSAHGYQLTVHRSGGSCGSMRGSSYIWNTEDFLNFNQWSGTIPDGQYGNRTIGTESITQEFCTGEVASVPPGSYCFYRNGHEGSCPPGFSSGTRKQDEQNPPHQQSTNETDADRPVRIGVVGESGLSGFDAFTWHFCCGSGTPNTAISFDSIRKQLPATFTLFRKGTSCQKINGRTSQPGWIYWDDEDSGGDIDDNDNADSGTLPEGSYTEDTRFEYCTYSASNLPFPPSEVKLVSVLPTEATLQWVIESGIVATHFKIDVLDSELQIPGTTNISIVLTGLLPDTPYVVRVFSGISSADYETVGREVSFRTCESDGCGTLTCNQGCANGTCTGPNYCTCFTGFTGATCADCREGYFGGTCQPCPPCVGGTCSDGLGGDGSCDCHEGYKGTACDNCIDGYYKIESLCLECDPSCATCNGLGSGNCLTCSEGRFVHGTNCPAVCPDGTYNDTNRVCQDCDSSCSTCDGPSSNSCSSCGGNLFLVGNECLENCPDGQYGDDNLCHACHPSCVTCDGEKSTDCLSCEDFMVLSFGRCACKPGDFLSDSDGCQPCEIANCTACSDENICTTCADGFTSTDGSCHKDNAEDAGGKIAGGIIGTLAILGLLAGVAFFFYYRKRKAEKKDPENEMVQTSGDGFVPRKISNYSQDSSRDLSQMTLLNTAIFSVILPGFLLLDYEKQIRQEEEFNAGGASTIYAATLLDPALISKHGGDRVVLKMIKGHNKVPDEVNKATFEREVSVNWTLEKEPNIIKMIGYCEVPRCIVYKLYERDLLSYLHTKEVISSTRIFHMAAQIAKGIQAIHLINAAHRDIKSQNVLIERGITDADHDIRLVICDFGLVVFDTDDTNPSQQFAKTAFFQGFSPKYASPELYENLKVKAPMSVAAYQKCDIFAFAVVIWELLTREIPWDIYNMEENEAAVRAGQRPETPPVGDDPSRLVLKAIMENGWNQDPMARKSIYEIVTKMDQHLRQLAG